MRALNVVIVMLITSLGLLKPDLAMSAGLQGDEKGFVIMQPGEEVWQENSGLDGVSYMKVYGEPSQPGVYVVRIRFAPWTMTKPHFHGEDRLVVIVKGTWYAGTDTQFDPEATTSIRQGGYMLHPAGGVHFDGAKAEEVVLQITGVGPSSTTFLDSEQGRVQKLKSR